MPKLMSDLVADIGPLARCKLWEGSLLQIGHAHKVLRYRDLQDYRNKLLRVWNDKEAGPTRNEKQLFNACGEVLDAAEVYES